MSSSDIGLADPSARQRWRGSCFANRDRDVGRRFENPARRTHGRYDQVTLPSSFRRLASSGSGYSRTRVRATALPHVVCSRVGQAAIWSLASSGTRTYQGAVISLPVE
jgi:hypothetical protein